MAVGPQTSSGGRSVDAAKGSAGETKDHLHTAADEAHITATEFDDAHRAAEDTTRLIGGFMSYLRRADNAGSKFKRIDRELQTPNTKPETP